MDKEEFESNLSKAMQVTTNALVNDGFITQEEAEYFLDTHTIVIASDKNGWNRWFKRFIGEKEVGQRMIVVEAAPRKAPPEEIPEEEKDVDGQGQKVVPFIRDTTKKT